MKNRLNIYLRFESFRWNCGCSVLGVCSCHNCVGSLNAKSPMEECPHWFVDMQITFALPKQWQIVETENQCNWKYTYTIIENKTDIKKKNQRVVIAKHVKPKYNEIIFNIILSANPTFFPFFSMTNHMSSIIQWLFWLHTCSLMIQPHIDTCRSLSLCAAKLTHRRRRCSDAHTLGEYLKWGGQQNPKQSFSETQVCSRPWKQLMLTENKIRGMKETEYITKQKERGEKRERRKTERYKERRRVTGSGASKAETVELADCEKPESPCRLFRVFLSAIMAH